MSGHMWLRIWDVEHGACAMLQYRSGGYGGNLAMIDCGSTANWTPGVFIRDILRRSNIDYLFITNADQDHMSGLSRLSEEGVCVKSFTRNRATSVEQLRDIKLRSGPLTKDAEKYLDLHQRYTATVSEPFNDHMDGIVQRTFYNSGSKFDDTNNLSAAVFVSFGDFRILFPGDLEAEGWAELLQNADFRDQLSGVTVLVAPHHGRESGYLEDIFAHCKPMAVVMSDKAKVHETQEGMTDIYRAEVMANFPNGVLVHNTGKQRRVLTTRRDGWIEFQVHADTFYVLTEKQG